MTFADRRSVRSALYAEPGSLDSLPVAETGRTKKCFRADPAYGEGVARALGLGLDLKQAQSNPIQQRRTVHVPYS
jgi:hypothetical protein